MPRQSPYSIVLSTEEKAYLEKLSRKYTARYNVVVRAKVILLAAEGLDNETIGQRLDLPRQIVSKWRKRFAQERIGGLENRDRPGRPPVFPPEVVVQVKALACELPYEAGIPLSRFSSREIAAETVRRGIVARISDATVWRWLDEDAIKPWQHRSWIYPRDPEFEQKAGRVLDLYQGLCKGRALGSNEYVICSDEKTSIQARVRIYATQPAEGHQSMKVEHEYRRGGALAYMAAWDVRAAKVFGHCEKKSGIAAFQRLVAEVMSREPYRSARRVFWVVDNGSSHRGLPSVERIRRRWPNTELVHLPVHASWLNQMEIYFGIVQRKVLTPNDFTCLEGVAQRLKEFARHYVRIAKPFEWKFTRDDLSRVLRKLREDAKQRALAA